MMLLQVFPLVLIGLALGAPSMASRRNEDVYLEEISNSGREYNTCDRTNTSGLILKDGVEEDYLDPFGRVTVLFKIAPHYLFQNQITLFRELRVRFEEAGFGALHFVLVVAQLQNETLYESFLEDVDALREDLDVIFERPNEAVLGMENNQAFVLDECGRLTYIIVPPWSHVQFPYVKAAVLSTLYDFPCGDCEIPYINPPYPGYFNYTSNEDPIGEKISELVANITQDEFLELLNQTAIFDLSKNQSTTKVPETESLNNSLAQLETLVKDKEQFEIEKIEDDFQIQDIERNDFDEIGRNLETGLRLLNETDLDTEETPSNDSTTLPPFDLPLRTILPVEHIHGNASSGRFEKYNYMVLRSDDPEFHGHLGPGDEMSALSNETTQTESRYVNQMGQIFKIFKSYEKFDEVRMEQTDIKQEQKNGSLQETSEDLKRHYGQLLQWITWSFN